jgi:H+/Cl- antiporter ClcA
MGFLISQLLHVHPERFNIGPLPKFSVSFLWKTLVITAACIIIAFVFCKGLTLGKKIAKKIFKNEFLRIAVGGILIVLFTIVIGTRDYNGGGIDVIERVFSGTVKYEAFAIKLLLTVICVACGYKGGEIIPTLFIGATLGSALGVILDLPIATAAAIGIAVLFVCATKCPVATIFLCGEMFGFNCVWFIAPIVILSFVVARYQGLYSNNTDIIQLIISQKKLKE